MKAQTMKGTVMGMEDILSREISDDIDALDNSKPFHKDCDFSKAARHAIKRSLRIGETCFRMQRINTFLFILVFLSAFKVENTSAVDLIFLMFKKMIGQ